MRALALSLLLLATPAVAGPSRDLGHFLQRRGYVAVPLTRAVMNHLQVDTVIDGHPVRLLVDTGATSSVLDRAVVEGWKVGLRPADLAGFGIGDTPTEVALADVADFRIGDIGTGPTAMYVTDLSTLRAAVTLMGGAPPAGLLGADYLQAHDAILAVGASLLYLKR